MEDCTACVFEKVAADADHRHLETCSMHQGEYVLLSSMDFLFTFWKWRMPWFEGGYEEYTWWYVQDRPCDYPISAYKKALLMAENQRSSSWRSTNFHFYVEWGEWVNCAPEAEVTWEISVLTCISNRLWKSIYLSISILSISTSIYI